MSCIPFGTRFAVDRKEGRRRLANETLIEIDGPDELNRRTLRLTDKSSVDSISPGPGCAFFRIVNSAGRVTCEKQAADFDLISDGNDQCCNQADSTDKAAFGPVSH